jgi:short-chain fatty acids transporter
MPDRGRWLDGFRDLGAGLSRVSERFVPDAWVICMALTAGALALSVLGAGAGVEEAVLAWGNGVWTLLTLAMQFTLAMVAAHACVVARPVYRALDRLAALPNPDRPVQAVLLAGLFSIATAYLNWAICLVACALFLPFIVRRNPRADLRVLAAASYLGTGTVWHGGLSGSAPLILATPGNPMLAPETGEPLVTRLYPVTETLFNGFNLAYIAVVGAIGLACIMALHPRSGALVVSPEQAEALLPKPPASPPALDSPAGRADRWRIWVWLAALLLGYPLLHSMVTRGFGATWNINAYNTLFLLAALLLHGRPLPFLRACRDGVDAAWGIIVQFPFYAGIFGLMQDAHLGRWLSELFASLATPHTFPLAVYVYSALMNLFVPSGGSKWLIEAPFLLPAGDALGVSPVTTVLAYAYGDSTTNMIQPFFAIPLLAVARLRFGDVAGYTFLVTIVCFAVSALAMLVIPIDL